MQLALPLLDFKNQQPLNVYFSYTSQVDLVKDGGHLYFITYLNAGEGGIELSSRAQAAFVLAAICDHHPKVLYAEQHVPVGSLCALHTSCGIGQHSA
jgi:hypothetical protein